MAAFALTAALALLTHYFAVFLLAPMALWLLSARRTRRAALVATGVLVLVGVALLPLISAQGGHGTQWIGRWPLSERLQAIPQYYLTGYTGSSLGHGIELLVTLPVLAGIALGLWRMTGPAPVAPFGDPRPASDTPNTPNTPDTHARPGARDRGASTSPQRGLAIALTLAACGLLIPIVLVAFGADYLAPRNLVAAMIPVTAAIAVLVVWPAAGPGKAGPVATIVLAGAIVVASLAISIDIELSPRLQRGNWRGLAAALRVAPRERVITTVELGTAPLEYYLPGLQRRASRRLRARARDRRDRLSAARRERRRAAGAGLSPAIPRGHRRARRLPLCLTRCTARQRVDAAPSCDHACKPRGTRAGGRSGVIVRAVIGSEHARLSSENEKI